MKQFFTQRESELFCPVCHASANCKAHLVERWEVNQRVSHLENLLSSVECPQTVYERVTKKFPTPEQCFDGAILISWKTMLSNPPKEFRALFHQEGSQLLKRYQSFIHSQLQESQQIRNLLQNSLPAGGAPQEPKEDSSKLCSPASSGTPPEKIIFSEETASSKSLPQKAERRPKEVVCLTDEDDFTSLVDEIAQNLI